MKNLFIILIVLCCTVLGFSQNEIPEIIPNIDEVEITAPHFTGVKNVVPEQSVDANFLRNYLKTNLIFPIEADEFNSEGTGVVEFVVTATGNIRDLEMVNRVCPEIDEEMIRVLKTTDGMWKPGLKDGKPVAMKKEVSLMFTLLDSPQAASERFYSKATHFYTKGSELMFEKRKFKKAERFYSEGITYLPYDQSLLLLRGICRYELDNKDGAREDWMRLKALGGLEMELSDMLAEMKYLKGYEELITMVKELP